MLIFHINIFYHNNLLGKPRIDDSVYFKTIYGSKSGSNITVKVTVPLVANPAPELSNFTWVSPESEPVNTIILQGDVIYKHCIESTVEMYDRNHFGNYTLMYNRETVATITIIPEGMVITFTLVDISIVLVVFDLPMYNSFHINQ